MSWRCACMFSLPVATLFLLSFALPTWQDGPTIYSGFGTIVQAVSEVGRSADVLFVFLLLVPNLLTAAGIVLLAVEYTAARIVAAVLGLVALLLAAQMTFCLGVLAFFLNVVNAVFAASGGPTGVREGFFVWMASMFLLALLGLIAALTGPTAPRPIHRFDEDDGNPFRQREWEDDDERFNGRRSEGRRSRRGRD